jgi:hypothetical protein
MANDNRVFLRMKRGSGDPLFENRVLAPLAKHGGILFPYSPQIQHVQRVNWKKLGLTHTNYQPQVFVNSENPVINITDAKFTATTSEDAEYMLAVLFFFKMVTKMNFGRNDPKRGTPPPVLELSGFGESQYQKVPVVITGVNYTYPNDIDYVSVKPAFYDDGMSESVPSVMNVSMELMVQYNVKSIRDTFTLADLAAGNISKKGYI